MNRIFSRARRVFRGLGRLSRQAGQGTVEYVALILLVALIMAGVVTAMKGYKTGEGTAVGDRVLQKMKDAVDHVQFWGRPRRIVGRALWRASCGPAPFR